MFKILHAISHWLGMTTGMVCSRWRNGVVEIGFRCDGCGRVSGIHKTNAKHPGMTDTDWDW